MNVYETDKLLAEYLLFHYGSPDETLPAGFPGAEGLNFPVRCVTECVDFTRLPADWMALDLGCAVGRSSFELARHGATVHGVDFSHRFIAAAETLRSAGQVEYLRFDEGLLTTRLWAHRPTGVSPERVRFVQGDASNLPAEMGSFDVVLLANLIDRLARPLDCLRQLPALVKPGGQLVVTSPYTWLTDFTPREHWLGGFSEGDRRMSTLDGLEAALGGGFDLLGTKDLPFLIREHARKFQLSVAQASIWRRRAE